jgi:hypothetical protein
MKHIAEVSAIKPMKIESLEQLQVLVDAPLECVFKLDGRPVSVTCRRVTQDVDEQVRALQRKAQPPYIKERNDYDNYNERYLFERDQNQKAARSLLVYTGCPTIAAKKPGLTNAADIHRFVKTILTETILELIALTIQAGGMELVERVNFTSTAA